LTRTREFFEENPVFAVAVLVLILFPPVIVALLGNRMPGWATVLVAWFVGLLVAVVGLRALVLVRERETIRG
jgi:Na+/melibiose symporter-like transporter